MSSPAKWAQHPQLGSDLKGFHRDLMQPECSVQSLACRTIVSYYSYILFPDLEPNQQTAQLMAPLRFPLPFLHVSYLQGPMGQ